MSSKKTFKRPIAPDLGTSFIDSLKGARINDPNLGTCGTAVCNGVAAQSMDITKEKKWSKEVRDLCVTNNIMAIHSTPVFGKDGNVIASFPLLFDEPRKPDKWEYQLADFGAHIASIALERERSRKALRESEEKYRTLFDSMPVAGFVCDTSGVLQYYNDRATELWGRKPKCGDPKEKYCGSFKLYLPDGTHLPHSQSPMVEVLRDGEPIHNVEVYIEQPGGSRIPVMVSFSPLKGMSGEVEGVITSFEDISVLKRTEKELKEMNETLEERVEKRTSALLSYQRQLRSLAFQLSKAEERERRRLATELHDNLGQLLAVAKMNLAGLQKDQLPDQTGVDELDDLLNKAITYTRKLMSDLKPPPLLNKEDLKALIDWVGKKMKRYDLDVAINDDGRPKPLSEEIQTTLMQCVRESLFNVVKHARIKQAYVNLSRRDSQIQITIEDQGTGFNPEDMEQASTTENEGNFGLFNVGEQMDLLGGSLNINSEPGKGTKITLCAPLKEESEKQVIATNQTSQTSQTSQTNQEVKVLLVDDHQMMRKGLRKIIEEEHDLMVIGEASDGKEAVLSARETFPDVIVMDINMPGMDGIQATQEIKSAMPDVRIIGLSFHDGDDVVQDMRSAGASAYLTKDEALETLCATIRSEAKLDGVV